MVNKLLEHFVKKICKKNKAKRIYDRKVIKKKGNKLYVKWRGYDYSFNSWIDKNDVEWNSFVYFPKQYESFWGYCTKNEVFHYGFPQKMWPNPQFSADLVTFTEAILNWNFIFLCSGGH